MMLKQALPLVPFMAAWPFASANARGSNTRHQPQQIELQGFLDELPTTGREWMTLENGVEFQPAEDFDMYNFDLIDESAHHHHHHHHHRQLKQRQRATYESQFVDGAGTYYNDYAQAWRLLGFYIDCNAPFNNANECNGDYDSGDDAESACQRILLWAAVSAAKIVLSKRIPSGPHVAPFFHFSVIH